MEIKFSNRPNKVHFVKDIDGDRDIWESRSAAAVAVVFGKFKGDIYVLMEKRSQEMDQPGKWCLPCGYFDWDENGWQAITREIYEETSLFLPNYDKNLVNRNKRRPFFVNTEITENRQNIALIYGMVFDFKVILPQEVFLYRNSEIEEIKWVKLNEINGLKVAFNHDKRICQAEKYFSKHLLPWWKWLIKKIFC
jgi:8-oxo-dGTP pyrophosphatase MutT (NUDIX family)